MATNRTTPSSVEEWARVETYIDSFLIPKDESLEAVQKHSAEEGLDDIAVAANQGKFLYLLAKTLGVKRYLEVGTLGGYSAIWVARALPADGKVFTFEIDEHSAKVSKENWKIAGVADKVTLVLGSAADTLPKFESEPFDLAFIDADKENNPTYFKEAKRLVRKGGVIIVDNVVRRGRTADLSVNTPETTGVRTLLEQIKNDPDVEATAISTVGAKGYDGFLYVFLN